MINYEHDVVLCLRVDDNPLPPMVNSEERVCANCGTGIWFAESTIPALKEHGVTEATVNLVCSSCVLKLFPELKLQPPTAAQMEAIRKEREVGHD